MSKINNAIKEVHRLSELAAQDKWLNRVHPLSKLLVTVLFITLVVSFSKYNMTGLSGMVLYLIVLFVVGEISFTDSIKRLRIVIPIVCFIGIVNPFFDTQIVTRFGDIGISGGIISMMTLIIKGVFTVLASYLLIVTTPIEQICYALRLLHLPKIMVTVILLIYRYITLFLEEVEKLSQAYALRAPGQKGISWKAWGPLVGQLLLRSMDRAEHVYESMCMRGYHGEFYYGNNRSFQLGDLAYLLIWVMVLIVIRAVPLFMLVGQMFTR